MAPTNYILGKALSESEKVACCLLDEKLRFVFTNPPFSQRLGYEQQELIGKDIGTLLTPELKKLALDAIHSFRKRKTDPPELWEVKAKDGELVRTAVEFHIVEHEGKEHLLVIAIDLTRQMRITTETQRLQDLLERTERLSKRGSFEIDMETNTHYWTDGMYYIFELDPQIGPPEIEWQTQFFAREDIEIFGNAVDKCYRDGTPYVLQFKLQIQDGPDKYIHTIGERLERDGKQVIYGSVMDITDLKKKEDELRQLNLELKQSNDRLLALINASPLAIYSINIEGIVQNLWNPASEKLFGWKKEQVIGRFMPHVPLEKHNEFKEVIQKLQEERGIQKLRLKRFTKEGNEIVIEITGGPLYDFEGNISEILIICSDVTELEGNRKALEESLQEKEVLLQEIHHRVKNNLAIVSGMLQLQSFETDSEVEKAKLHDAQSRIQSIGMVHELLYRAHDFSKIELKTYYSELVSKIENNMHIEASRIKHHIDVSADHLNINQAVPLGLLINELLTNSIKYAFNGKNDKLWLSIRKKGNQFNILYRDNGPGFDIDVIDKSTGIGWQLINTLLKQLNADYTFDTDNKFELVFTFEENTQGSQTTLEE